MIILQWKGGGGASRCLLIWRWRRGKMMRSPWATSQCDECRRPSLECGKIVQPHGMPLSTACALPQCAGRAWCRTPPRSMGPLRALQHSPVLSGEYEASREAHSWSHLSLRPFLRSATVRLLGQAVRLAGRIPPRHNPLRRSLHLRRLLHLSHALCSCPCCPPLSSRYPSVTPLRRDMESLGFQSPVFPPIQQRLNFIVRRRARRV